MSGMLVESPGTAPGSEPFIMGAFIAIFRVAPDTINIGPDAAGCKGRVAKAQTLGALY